MRPFLESLDELQPWMPWVHPVPSVQDSEEYCRQAYAKFLARSELPFQLFLKESGEFVGGSGLQNVKWEVPSFEIGYWCRSAQQGRGYISEAVRGLTKFGFETLGAQRIAIRCDARNIRSRRVAERAGYKLEGRLRNDEVAVNGELRNTLVFALIADDWSALHPPG